MRFLLTVILPSLLFGLSGLTSLLYHQDYQWLLVTGVFWILLSGLGIATGFHRIYSHNTWVSLSPWLDGLLLACGTLAGQGSSLTWVAVHRGYHHRYSDTARDPHTPVVNGFWHAVLLWYTGMNPQKIEHRINHRYAGRLLKSRMHQFVHRYYTRILYAFVLSFCAIDYYLTGSIKAAWYGYGIALSWAILQDNLVNYFGHAPRWGYRNFETGDQSSNFPPLGYLGWGQGWHNNHHALPERFNFGYRWWEFDPCRLFTPLLRLGGYRRQDD